MECLTYVGHLKIDTHNFDTNSAGLRFLAHIALSPSKSWCRRIEDKQLLVHYFPLGDYCAKILLAICVHNVGNSLLFGSSVFAPAEFALLRTKKGEGGCSGIAELAISPVV